MNRYSILTTQSVLPVLRSIVCNKACTVFIIAILTVVQLNAQTAVEITNHWKPEKLGIDNGTMVSAASPQNTIWIIEATTDKNLFRIKNAATGGYLNNQKGALVIGPIEPGWLSAVWQLKLITDYDIDYYQIVNAWTGTYLHNQNGKLELGPLGLPGWWSAQWGLSAVNTVASNNKQAVATQQGSKVEDFQREADAFFAKKDYANAIKYYTLATQDNPQNARAYLLRGNAFYAINKLDDAIADYTIAVQKSVGDSAATCIAYANRGNVYYRLTKYDAAIADYSNAVKQNRQNDIAWNGRGMAYFKKNLMDSAFADYKMAYQLQPGKSVYYFNIADVYVSSGQNDIALKMFASAFEVNPNDTSFYFRRGIAYRLMWKPELALNDFNTYIKAKPTDANAFNQRSLTYKNLSKYDEAKTDLETAIRLSPTESLYYTNMLVLQAYFRKFNEAHDFYNAMVSKGINIYSQSPSVDYLNAVVSGIFKNDYQAALSLLDKALNNYNITNKTEAAADYNSKKILSQVFSLKAYVLEQLNRFDEAKNLYKQSLVLEPGQPTISAALQNIITRAQQADKSLPVITLISPSQSTGLTITAEGDSAQIIGRAKDESGVSVVKINGKAVSNVEDDGLFISNFAFKNGINTITVEATCKTGGTAVKTFTINAVQPETRSLTQATPASVADAGAQNYYAIIIAEQDYQDKSINSLSRPMGDAREFKEILQTKYTFPAANIDTLFNGSREDILGKIYSRCATLGEHDNLLIFYAGHGVATKNRSGDFDGYLVPVSAKRDVIPTYISANDINTAFNNSNAKHILFIADACFSGAFLRDLGPADRGMKKLLGTVSRTAMTSGNIEPVPDNSKFIFYLKKRLQENSEQFLSATDLFGSFKQAVLNNTDNIPRYGAIFNVGDEGGDFIFIKK